MFLIHVCIIYSYLPCVVMIEGFKKSNLDELVFL